MPAIRLLSSQNSLRSPCYHGGDHASIRLRSSAITLLLSPHTPGGSQAPLSALGGRALPRPGREEGTRRAEGPRHRHAPSNTDASNSPPADQSRSGAIARKQPVSQIRQASITVSHVTRTTTGRSNLLPGASHLPNPPKRSATSSVARCLKITGTGFSRVACHIPGSSLVGTARSRPARLGRNLESRGIHAGRGHRTGGGWGVAGDPGARPIIYLSFLSRAASENFRRPSQKTRVYL